MSVPRASGSPSTPWRPWVFAVTAGLALTAALTYPTARVFGHAGRLDSGDGRFSIWNVAWVAHALVDAPRQLFDANIFHPHPDTLTYSELNLVAGVIAAPVYAATRNPIAASNAAVLVSLFGAFLAMWALVRRLTGSSAAALVSSTGYTFSAYTAAHTAHVQLLMVFGFPLIMLAFHRLVRQPTVWAGVWLGTALAATALGSGYYGVFGGGLVGLAALLWARRGASYWVALGCAALTAAALVLPVLVPYLRARTAAGPMRAITVDELRAYSANWRDYLTADGFLSSAALRGLAHVKSAVLPGLTLPPMTEVLFPGFVIAVMAAAGLVAGAVHRPDRRVVLGYAAIGSLALWVSFGPDAGAYGPVMTLLPGSSLLRAPARIGVVVIFALAVLAGFGVRRLGQRRPWLAPLCTAIVVAEVWVPWPLRAMPAEAPAYAMLRDLPRGGVVEFPFVYTRTNFHQHTWAMVRSMENWQPLVNGYSDFTPEDFLEMAEPVNGFPDQESFAIMRRHDVRYVIVRASEYGDYRERLLARFPPYAPYLRRLTNEQDVWLFEIVGWPQGEGSPSSESSLR